MNASGYEGPRDQPDEDPEDMALACDLCGDEVEQDYPFLCGCGSGLCEACVVEGPRDFGCAPCVSLQAPALRLVRGGVL